MTTEDKLQDALKQVEQQKSVTRQAVEDERNRLLDEIAYTRKVDQGYIENQLAKARASVLDNPYEVRAFALKSAIDSKSWLDLRGEGSLDTAKQIVAVAGLFVDYLTGETNEAQEPR